MGASEQPQQSPAQGRSRVGTLSAVTLPTLHDVAADLPPKRTPPAPSRGSQKMGVRAAWRGRGRW